MAEEENVFLEIRKNSGGIFNRGYSDTQSFGDTQGGNISKLLDNTSYRDTNWQGTVNLGKGAHPDIQYSSGPFEALTRKTDTDVFVENSPYYAAIAATSLFGGALVGGAAAGITEALALPVIAKGAIDISSFLLGASATGMGTQAGFGAVGINDATEQDKAFSPGPITAAQALPTAAVFGRVGIPKTLGEVAGAGIFGGTVAGHSLITGAFDPNRTTGQVAADAALEGVEGLAFGLFAKPTALGAKILGGGHYVGQNNPLYTGAIKNLYTNNGTAGTWNNSAGRGGVAPNGTGGVSGFEPAKPEGDGTIGVPVIYGHPNKPQQTGLGSAGAPIPPEPTQIVPTASGRGDATHYDPARGTITVTSALPDGTSKVTIYTNIGGQKLKAEGPYAGTPDVFSVSVDKFGNIIGPSGPQTPGLTPPTWNENSAAAEDAARNAAKNATKRQWKEESIPVTEPVVPPKPTEPTDATKPPEPVVPPKTAEQPVEATTSTGPVVATNVIEPRPSSQPLPANAQHGSPEWNAWIDSYRARKPLSDAWDAKYGATHWHDGTPRTAEYVVGTPEYIAKKAQETATRGSTAAASPVAAEPQATPVDAQPQASPVAAQPQTTQTPAQPRVWTARADRPNQYRNDKGDGVIIEKGGLFDVFRTDPKNPGNLSKIGAALSLEEAQKLFDSKSAPAQEKPKRPVVKVGDLLPGRQPDIGPPVGKPLPMPTDKEGLKNYNNEMASPILGGLNLEDGKPITVSELTLEDAESLFKREKEKVVGYIKSNQTNTPAFRQYLYPTGLANLRKLKEHIDKLKAQGPSEPIAKPPVTQTEIPGTGIDATFNLNGETVAPPPKDPPAEDTTTGTLPGVDVQTPKAVPVASIPKTPVTKEELIKGLRPMEEAPEEVIRTLTPAERQEYFVNRNEFLKTQVTNSTEVKTPKKKEKYVPVPGSKSHPLEPDGITIARDQTFNDNSITTTQRLNLQDKVDQHDQELKLRNRDESVDLTKVSTQAIKEFGDEQLIKHHNGEYTEADQKWDEYVGNEAVRRSEAESRVDSDSKKDGGVHGDIVADIRNITNTHRWPKLPAWMKDEENDAILESQKTLKFKTAFPVGYDPTRTDITHKEEMKLKVLAMFTPIIRALDTRGWGQLRDDGVPELFDHISRALSGEKLTPSSGIGGNVDKETAVKNKKRLFAQHPDLVKIAKINEKLAKAIAAGKPANVDYKPPVGDENNPFSESVIPDPRGRKNVLVQKSVVGERDKDTDRLQVVGVDAPTEIHKSGMRNPEPLELEAPGGPSTESWPAYQLALEREGAKNVYIVRLPGTQEGGKSYNMAITGLIAIKFKKGEGGLVIPVLDSVSMEHLNKSTKHWLNWKIVEFYPEVVDNRGSNLFLSDPRYSYNLAETGGREFGPIENSSSAKKEFIERLFATFEVRVPGDFKRDESSYGFDNKPTLYFNQSAMIESEVESRKEDNSPEGKAIREANSRTELPSNLTPETPAEGWKRRGRPAKVKPVSLVPDVVKSRAELDAGNGVKGAKAYTARFNIGGERNPLGFGGEIRGEKGVKVDSTPANWSPENLKLIADYLSPAASELRNLGYPNFFLNTHISGQESNWVSVAVPVGNGNFVRYEVNPKDAGRSGNSYATMARLFRTFLNSDGKQIGQQTEVLAFRINGFETTSLAPDGKALFKVPAVFHAQMAAGQDLITAKAMNVTEETLTNSQLKTLDGTVHTDLKTWEEEELTPPGLRRKMEIYNAMNGGDTINRAIIAVITSLNDAEAQATLINVMSIYAKTSPSDSRQFIIELIAAQSGGEGAAADLVITPKDITEYEKLKIKSIWPSEAGQLAAWAKNGYKRIIFEVGHDDPLTGQELPDEVQATDENNNPRWKKKPGPNGEQMPFMISNPKKWNAKFAQWVGPTTFSEQNGAMPGFVPTYHQVKGVNMAMTRFWPNGIDTKPREYGGSSLPRGFGLFDAPGTGKTLQMLMTAKLYFEHLSALRADPNSPWFGHPAQPVLIVTQNVGIILNAFKGDAIMAGIALNGTFGEDGFTPNEYKLDANGGRILTGDSWIDIATYNSIKPEMKMVPKFNKDGTPKMVPKYAVDEHGDYIPGPVDGKRFQLIDPATGLGVTEQDQERAPAGPPKKGSGVWGVVMFDESHNMKNDESGRSDAGFELLTRAQHSIFASGTPIDKPQQAAVMLAMLLDRPLAEAANLTGMNVSYTQRKAEKIRLSEPGFTPAMSKIKLTCTGGGWGGTQDERTKQFQKCYIGMRTLRDEAGKAGAVLRRGTNFFGNPNIWLDATDGMHENAKTAIFEMQAWWEEQIALEKEAGGGGMKIMHLMGQALFESKRLTALSKLGVPNTEWNPSTKPMGVAKVLLNELKEGRKVIITVDTSNLFNLVDSESIRKFKGLRTDNDEPRPYESEAVILMRWLDSMKIPHGSITGNFDQLQRQATIDMFQKNNPDMQVIIMTIQSGGTGLSIDDRSGTGGKFGVKKSYTQAEIDNMVAMSAGQVPGAKTETGSFPRSVLITSSPWGGDVFIQAMGRTDRMLSSSPTRIYAFTSHISDGDQRLSQLLREKVATTQAMVETGDPLEAQVHAGIVDDQGRPVIGGEDPIGLGVKSEEQLRFEQSSAKAFLRGELGKAKHLAEKKRKDIKERLPKNEDEWTAKDTANSKRWAEELAGFEDRQVAIKQHVKDLEAGTLSGASVLNNKDMYKGVPQQETETNTEDDEGGENDLADISIIPKIGSDNIGTPLFVTGHKSKQKENAIITNLYGVGARISGGSVTPEQAEKIKDTIVNITRPFLKQHAAGTLNRTQIGGILRMARDLAHLLTDTRFHTEVKTSDQADKLGYAGYANMAGRAILTILATDDPKRMSGVHETLFHEIGHILFKLVPDSMKLEMKAELDAARKQWHDNLHQDDPRRAIVMPTEDWNVTDGADRYNTELRPLVNKTPVPGMKPYDYTGTFQIHRGSIKGSNSNPNTRNSLDGLMITSKGLELAHTLALQAFPGLFGAVKPVITQIHLLEGERPSVFDKTPGAVMGGSGIGGTGQLDIKAAGRTPAQSAGMIAAALIQLGVFKIRTKTGKEKWQGEEFPIIWESLHDGKTHNGKTSIRGLSRILRSGLSHTIVNENGDIVIHAAQTILADGSAILNTNTNPVGSNNTLAKLTVKTSDTLSSLFKHFGHLRSNYSIDNLREIMEETNLNQVTDNADSINEVAQGTFSGAGKRTRYELTNLNEWQAQNTQKLLADYYGNETYNESTHLQAAITSSLYVNASFSGNTSVTRSIMARLMSGEKLTDASSSEAPSIGARELLSKQRGQLIDKASPNTGPPDPSSGNIEKAGLEPDNVSDDDGLAVGRGADLAAGAARMGAGAMDILNRIKAASANAALQTPITGNARKWLQEIKRRKIQTGKPDDAEGLSLGYIGGAFLGTVIGQLENIAKITKNEDVAELARRLYPAQNNGLLAKPTFSEEYLATRMYFNNVSEGIIEKHNGKDLKRSTKTSARVLRRDVVKAMTPEFKKKLAEYFLRVHNPDYNKMERMRDEIEGLLKNVKPITAQLLQEMKEIGVRDLAELKVRLKVLSDEANYEAKRFKNGSKFDKVALGREADHFLGEFMHGGTLDKIMMDIGRCMAISPTNPLYSERARLFGLNVVKSAEDLSLNWSHAFREWVELRTGEEIPDYGSSWRPRIMDAHVILDGPENRKEHFVQEAARAFLADNSHQRVTLPITFRAHLVSGNKWARSFPTFNGQGVQEWATTKKDIKEYIDSEAPMPDWMERRIKDIVFPGIMPKHSDGLGFDIKCDPASFTQINPTTTTSDGQLAKVQLIAYRELLAKECKETFGSMKDARASSRVIDKEFIMIEKVIKRLTESHTRKVVEHRLDEQSAYKLAREMLNRINHRSTGVASSGQGYSDIFSGQHGTLKKPDSLKGRTMDTEAADDILGQFMIQDPRVFLPHYNKSVTRNVMIKHYIPESFFENLQRSVVGDQSTKQYWGEIVAAVRKITESEDQHDMNGIVKTATTLVAAHIFMPITATLQVLEPLNAGIVIGRGHAAIPMDGARAFGGGSLLLMKGVANSITKLVGEIATLGQTGGVDFRIIRSTQDEFLRRLALRTGILQSTFFESLPASSADPRSWWQVQADKQVARFHHSGNMLSVVTDQSRVAVLKRSVMALEVTADEILTKSSISGKSVLDTMTPLQMQLFRNLGVPDIKLKDFLQHCLNIRALTGGDMSTVPEHQMDTIIQQALGNSRGGDEVARLYENALGRWNSMTVQRNFSATQQFARALIDRQVGTFAGSMMFYLTHYNSSFARNVILPMYNTMGNTFSNRHTQNYQIGGQQPDKYQKIGDYMTDIRYPMGGATNVARVIPPLILTIAMSSFANIQLRELRHTMRPNPSLTYADERPWYIKTLAGVDAAGFLGNLSMPINVVNSLRYNRQAAQIAAGPLLGAYAGLIDLMKNENSIRNSPNTPTAERATAKALYDYVVRPSMQILLGAITPVSDVGNLINFAATQAAGQPTLREEFMRWKARDAGNQGRKVPTDKQTLDSLKKNGTITPAQYEAGIRERKMYEQDAERNKIFGGSKPAE